MFSWADKAPPRGVQPAAVRPGGWLVMALALASAACMAQGKGDFPGIGRAATPQEVAAWDIDVRPDFKGLPAGSGSVARGQEVWEGKCASCHGVFGEANHVFSPLVGGTTAEDIATGHAARLKDSSFPGRTTLMKTTQLSTLWDYINRAMPWTQPKSLTVDEVYAVTAFLLNLGGIVPDNFTLSDANIRETQQRMPNRNGATTAHRLWPGTEFGGTRKPDVSGSPCMNHCKASTKVASILPDFARDAHGNLAEQNRIVGPQRGADTTRPEARPGTLAALPAQAAAAPAASTNANANANANADAGEARAVQALMQKNNCTACHTANSKLVGPSWAEVASRHAGKGDYLAGRIKSGGSGVWGDIPMPAQTASEADIRRIAAWLATGARR